MTESMTSNFIDPVNKQPLKRLEPTIQRFTKIALPTDLGRLSQHKKMIKRCREQEDWDKLNTEQINARLTVQQLKANIREMDKARCQIRDEDLPALDARVNPLKEEAMEAIASFIIECGMETLTYTLPEDVLIGGKERVVGSEQTSQGTEADERNHIQDQTRDEEVEKLRRTLEETKHVEETWNKLKGDLEDVSATIQDFAQQVKQQKELTDRIEDNIDTAQTNVLQGTRSIITVSNIKNVMLPLTGALLGTAVGGPLGLMVGYKVGAVAAFGGGAVGFLGARIAKRKSTEKNNKDLELIEEEQRTLSESKKDTDKR
ncbi:putative syntaxin-17 [Apostichopus japonicus]|uniref:Putative syntaxin-17 n=1 Tax=Stichopus japonicus TaxID=307972 RepID=A0A2G8K728_STIJA|nr:putative syntaxin-17 [Apostichopus japonicus]